MSLVCSSKNKRETLGPVQILYHQFHMKSLISRNVVIHVEISDNHFELIAVSQSLCSSASFKRISVDLGLDAATVTSFEVMKIKLGLSVIFISLTSALSQTSGFEKAKWTVIIIDAIFFVWFSSCYMLGIYDTI